MYAAINTEGRMWGHPNLRGLPIVKAKKKAREMPRGRGESNSDLTTKKCSRSADFEMFFFNFF
jgi:hypothetical protein